MGFPLSPWPYAAESVNQYEWLGDRLAIWVTFGHPMDVDVVPAANLFSFRVDRVEKTPVGLNWFSEYTLNMQVQNIPAHPARVLCTYNGPDENLRTAWQKQWEPWKWLYCQDVPYGWEHILEVDVDNARVTINGTLTFASITLTAGIIQSPDISRINIIWLDCSAGNLSIKSFLFGLDGQRLFIARLDDCPNDTSILHRAAPPGQHINLHAGLTETLTNEYGGWTLVCDGLEWFDLSHAKHV